MTTESIEDICARFKAEYAALPNRYRYCQDIDGALAGKKDICPAITYEEISLWGEMNCWASFPAVKELIDKFWSPLDLAWISSEVGNMFAALRGDSDSTPYLKDPSGLPTKEDWHALFDIRILQWRAEEAVKRASYAATQASRLSSASR